MQRWEWTRWVAGCASVAMLSLGMTGCNSGTEYKTAQQIEQDHGEHDHGHSHGHAEEGPHHGALVELGEEEFHAEIVVDGKSHTLRVYLLGPDGKTAAATTATEATITPEGEPVLTLKPAAGQTEGEHSVFELVDEKAVHELAEAGFLHGTLKIKVGEKEYSQFVDAHFDDEHEHEAAPATEAAPAAEAAAPADPAPLPEAAPADAAPPWKTERNTARAN